MDLLSFHRIRVAVQQNGFPGTGGALEMIETDLRDSLMASGLFEQVEVEQTDDPDQLVIALCHFPQHIPESRVADEVRRVWQDRLSYPFWEVHAIKTDDHFVEFEAATRASSDGPYITVHLVADTMKVPEQRVSSD